MISSEIQSNVPNDHKLIFNAQTDDRTDVESEERQHTPQIGDNYSSSSLSDSSSNNNINNSSITGISVTDAVNRNHCQYFVPIEGYEVMEQRSRYTIFRLRVENLETGQNWLVFRRYTDFVRLRRKLRIIFPRFSFALPSKKWFGDNFDPIFLEDRQLGLQVFLNNIMSLKSVTNSQPVRDFLCLNEESHDDSVALESSHESLSSRDQTLQSTIFSLNKLLKFKDDEIQFLRKELSQLKARLSILSTDENHPIINQKCDEQLINGVSELELKCPELIVDTTRDSPDGCCSHTNSVN